MITIVLSHKSKMVPMLLEDCINNHELPDTVRKLSELVQKQIMVLDNMHCYSQHKDIMDTIIKVGDIKHIFVKIYKYRRGIVILALQKSSKGIRRVWYFTQTIHHSATCFGTTPDIDIVSDLNSKLDKTELYKSLQKIL
tara:strand:- start:3 stop:419 length:417 start_codon:yes stop_codon:yes gene_type:complete